jgi:YVTN family beta-propeller protein
MDIRAPSKYSVPVPAFTLQRVRTHAETENVMSHSRSARAALALLLTACAASAQAEDHKRTLVVTMTNDPTTNAIKVYDADTRTLIQTLSTHGRGGVDGSARAVRQSNGEIVAVANNGSNSVAIFRRDGDILRFERVVTTTSAPVSVDFANGHMYVAGATTVDSFAIHGDFVGSLDGTTNLLLDGGGTPPVGSTAQVEATGTNQLLVTLKADPDPGAVDVVSLDERGRVSGGIAAVSAPTGSLTPFGFVTYPDGTAVMTLAHSNQDALFRNGAFAFVVDAGQAASCWMTRDGKYVFVANTGSHTISRVIGTGSHVFVDNAVAANIATGGAPADIDAVSGVLGVVDHVGGQSHVSLFTYNEFGELAPLGAPIIVGVPNANGVAVLAASDRNRN